ncbi:Uncharacterised protein [Mycobacteroides abscessus subsp. massiliense]|nr:Uncharacterised protein [Mycobacteroides abscessus subsp. massiliense]SKH39402.1 Uncharacterised protein [Mycobacteroides abscessus subsp. massiliense]SKI31423.1 Uncharacterised protein [Mycobacteroides abscessus subsp. massiliense]SKJ17597.1 Uncharacterised protein [Mycobacteroides abscessus subsp. massiliense]SKJ90775.1 Uncharacterised protein [Mycobacteroides abscessus subsp. massiliense]
MVGMALCAGDRRPGPKRPQRSAAVVLALAVALIAALGCASTGHNPPPVAGGTVVLTAMNLPRDMAADISAGVSVAGAGVHQQPVRADDHAGCSASHPPCVRVCPADAALAWDTPATVAPPPSTALTYPVWAMREGPPPRPAARAAWGRALTEQLGVIRR